jgi:YD repeat-containing protein
MKLNITTKFLSLFVAAAITLSSCGDDKDEITPIVNETGCKLTEVNTSDEGSSSVQYNAKGLVSKVITTYNEDGEDVEYTTVYTYNGSNQLIKEEEFGPDGESEWYTTYEYSNGLLSKSKEYEGGELDYTATYTYDASKRLIEISEDDEYIMTFEYNSAGNVTEAVAEYMGETYMMFTYENYDNKLNPIAAAPGMLSLFEGSSKNNPGRVTSRFYYGSEDYVEDVIEYTYQYNNKNLPTKITQSNEEGEFITNFTYQCN